MDFLKRHYEKVILLGLFVLFIVLMFLVLDVIAQSRELDKTELRLPRGKNYTKMAALDTPGVLLDKTKLIWESSVSREQSVNYSDLIHVFKIAECPYCREKDQNKIALIPLTEFSSALNPKGKCSFCRTHLPVPPERAVARAGVKTENDLDGDGISNDDERKYNLDPNNPDDALFDNDGDGFSNRFEIANGTDPGNKSSHPPFWWRLRLKDIAQIELPVKFMAITNGEDKNKKNWDMQFNSPHRRLKGRTRSQYARIGDTVDIEKTEYRVDDVERNVENVLDENKKNRQIDKSRVFLSEVTDPESGKTPDKLIMTIGQPAYSSDKRPVLEDSGKKEDSLHVMRIGDLLYVGYPDSTNLRRDSSAGRYQLKEVDADKKVVRIVDMRVKANEKGERPLIEITADGKVPVADRPIEKEDKNIMPDVE